MKCQVEKQGKKWKITALEPVEFFREVSLQSLFHGQGQRRLDQEVELGHARDGGADGSFGGRLDGDHERQVAPVGVGQLEHGVDRNILGGQRGGELRDDSRAILDAEAQK